MLQYSNAYLMNNFRHSRRADFLFIFSVVKQSITAYKFWKNHIYQTYMWEKPAILARNSH